MPKFYYKKSAGFTLLELLIYIGILGIAGVFLVSIFSQVSRTYLQSRSRTEVTQNLRIVSDIFQQAIQSATLVNSATTSYLSLKMQDPNKDPTEFRLQAGAVEMKEGTGSWKRITSKQVTVTQLIFSKISTNVSFIDPINRWAWNGNGLGWIDFNPTEGNVFMIVDSRVFYGYAKAQNAGYFSLNCQSAGDCTYPYNVYSDANGNLYGFAWNDKFGWVSFNCANDHDPNTPGVQPYCAANGGYDYKVTIDNQTGDFSGWAWISGFGWISFNCNNSGIGNTCASNGGYDYKVTLRKTIGRPIHAVRVQITIQYNTSNPLAMYTESRDFAIVLSEPPSVRVSAISPSSRSTCGNNCSPTITGQNFQSGATVKLSRPGFDDIYSSGSWTAAGGGTSLSGGTFNLSNAALGTWDVWVINPTGEIGVLPDGFDVD